RSPPTSINTGQSSTGEGRWFGFAPRERKPRRFSPTSSIAGKSKTSPWKKFRLKRSSRKSSALAPPNPAPPPRRRHDRVRRGRSQVLGDLLDRDRGSIHLSHGFLFRHADALHADRHHDLPLERHL